jgi:hypothetical protein
VVESAVDQLIPAYLRPDLVLELRDASGAPLLAIVLEIQRGKEPEKKDSWLFHVAAVRARRQSHGSFDATRGQTLGETPGAERPAAVDPQVMS